MVTYMVFSRVLVFDFGFVVIGAGCSALTAAGPLVAFVLGLFFFLCLFLDVDFRDDESEFVAAIAAEDRGSMEPLVSLPGFRDAAAVEALRSLHSSLWPARHAARWQACLQYLRCRQPEQVATVDLRPQNAHSSVI